MSGREDRGHTTLPHEHPYGPTGKSLSALGTLRLEGTADAVTSEQAADLLPLWQIIEGGSLKSAAETEAVLSQIKGKMTESQIAAIEATSMTMADMQAWMAEQGIEMRMPQGGGQGAGPVAMPGNMQNSAGGRKGR